MEKAEIIRIVNSFLIEEFEVEEEKIEPSANLKNDLGIDSLDFVDIAVIIEKNFGSKIKGEEMVGIKTLDDFYNFIYQSLN